MDVLSKLNAIFPPPRYMSLPSVGIDMSDTSLKYMYLTKSDLASPDIELAAWGDVALPEGALVEGDIKDVKKLVPALQEARAESGVSYARISLPEEHAYIFETDVKRNMSEREVRGLLEFRLQENVPISPRDALFDYDIVDNDTKEDVFHTVVTVYGKAMIQKYYEACMAAGLVPVSFEVESQALARAVVERDHRGAVLIVDFGRTHTGIGIVYRGTLMYTSAVKGSGAKLTAAVRTVLGDVTEKELTQIKNEHGLRGTHKNDTLQQAIVQVVEEMVEELHSHIEYWNAREGGPKERAITEVILCGGSVNLAGLPEYLSDALGTPARRAAVWQNVFALDSFVPPIDRRHSYGYATTIGLALVNVTGEL